MKILAVADLESRYYYDHYTPGKLDEFDLIISCGDLNRSYLEFLQTLGNVPLLYVHGNHDDRYDVEPPEGCTCIDDRIFVWHGIRFLGLGGSYRYRNGTYMYSERQMRARIRRLWFQLWWYRGFDVLVTHAPARHVNDFESVSHRGFECFHTLLEKYSPQYFVHGHIHMNYGMKIPRTTELNGTTVINAWDHYVIELPDRPEDEGTGRKRFLTGRKRWSKCR